MNRRTWFMGLVLALAACGGDGSSNSSGAANGGGGSNATGGNGVGGGGGVGGDGGSAIDPCAPFGHFGVPENSFTLPLDQSTYYPDVQTSFPEVDWSTLDRLYLPAGEYQQLRIGNLPDRDADRPLIITNLGGQVKIGPADDQNYLWVMDGGSHWILTGRYDPDSQTGDVSVPGHRCGAYADARGNYGFLSDDAFDLDAPYLHMGISVGNATDFEIEFIEVTRSGFAGIRLLNATDIDKPMANVKLHDTYVHDVDGEGIYLGWTGSPPSNLMPGLQVYNNRFIRTGNEALQTQNLGDGSHIHHNTMVYAAMNWRDNHLGAYQDANAQMGLRSGNIVVEKNIYIGSASTLWSVFQADEGNDGDVTLVFRDNYVSTNRVGLAGYFGGDASAGSSYSFEGNIFRAIDFSYDEIDPNATDGNVIFRFGGNVNASISLLNNRWQGDNELVAGLGGPNGRNGNISASGNDNGDVTPPAVVNGLVEDPLLLEFWTAVVSRAPGSPPRIYQPGEWVIYLDGKLYRAISQSSNEPPPDNPNSWEQLPDSIDDVRVVEGSPYYGWGVQ